jgi:4-hydroxy-2-oxovalerate/4-hydroxy-2-oxohexanoate aldolase
VALTPAHTDEEYLRAVIPEMKKAKVSALLLPADVTARVRALREALDPEPDGQSIAEF